MLYGMDKRHLSKPYDGVCQRDLKTFTTPSCCERLQIGYFETNTRSTYRGHPLRSYKYFPTKRLYA